VIAVVMVMFIVMVMIVAVLVRVLMSGFIMTVIATMLVVMVVFVRKMNIKFDAGDALAFILADVQMKAVQLELLQFVRQFVGIYAEVEQGADEHVAADAAEDVEVKRFHFSAKALI